MLFQNKNIGSPLNCNTLNVSLTKNLSMSILFYFHLRLAFSIEIVSTIVILLYLKIPIFAPATVISIHFMDKMAIVIEIIITNSLTNCKCE